MKANNEESAARNYDGADFIDWQKAQAGRCSHTHFYEGYLRDKTANVLRDFLRIGLDSLKVGANQKSVNIPEMMHAKYDKADHTFRVY